MRTRIAFGSMAMMIVMAFPVHAGGKADLQRYFNDTSIRVKATDNPDEKRAILNESLQTMSKAMNMVQGSPLISKDEGAGIERFKATLLEKQDELAGNNGYVMVPDDKLNAFSDYVVQDMEQAAEFITISVVTLLLIIILIVLVVK